MYAIPVRTCKHRITVNIEVIKFLRQFKLKLMIARTHAHLHGTRTQLNLHRVNCQRLQTHTTSKQSLFAAGT